MEKDSLKKYRIFVPGLIIFLSFLPLFKGTINVVEIFRSLGELKDILYLIPIIILGILYHIFDFGGYFLRPSLGAIHQNLKDRILSQFSSVPSIVSSEAYLRSNRIILDIFYFFIDNDESLKERAKNIYLNGLLWSSVSDTMTVSAFAAPIYAIVFLATDNVDHILLAGIFLLLLMISGFILQPLVENKHIRLQNEQLDYIFLHKNKALEQKLIDAAQHK